MLKAHVAEPIVGMAKIEHGRIRAERLAAAPAQVAGLVGGEELGAELPMLRAVAALGGGGAGPPMGGAAAALPDQGGAAGFQAGTG